MTPAQINSLLRSGITAVKAGDKSAAQQQFLKIIEFDERHEKAWLCLSTAVSTLEDKIICLENVLAINPDNAKVSQKLSQLQKKKPQPTQKPTPKRNIVRREYKLSGAGAILYPERAVKEWEWVDPTQIQPGQEVGYQAHTAYDDVWSKEIDLCPYCAAAVEPTHHKCPQCHQTLVSKQFRYPNMSSLLHLFWVILFGLANINLVQMFYDLIFWRDIIGVLLNLGLVVLFLILGTGAMLRKYFAFLGAQILSSIILFVGFLELVFPFQVKSNALPSLDPALTGFVAGLGEGFDLFLTIFEMAGAAIVLILAIFMLAPDFEQVALRRVARVKKGLPHGADYHLEANRAAKAGMWATAVLHWQRAASIEPTRLLYQKKLAAAYLRLNFVERSIDVLQSALQLSTNPDQKAQIQRQIDQIKHHADLEGQKRKS